MAIIRVNKKGRPFVIVDKTITEDSRLSFKARGLLVYLLGKPNNWEINIAHLVSEGMESKYHIKLALKELREAGYLKIEPIRGEGGRMIGSTYDIFDEAQEPDEIDDSPSARNTVSRSDHRAHEIPAAGISAPLINNNTTTSNNLSLTNLNNHQQQSVTPREQDAGGDASFDLSFIPEKDQLYTAAIEEELRQTPPSQIDYAYLRIMPGAGRSRRGVDLTTLLGVQAKYGHEKLVAAMVYTRGENPAGEVGIKYLVGVMNRWAREATSHAPQLTGQNAPWQPPADNLDDLPDYADAPPISEELKKEILGDWYAKH